MGRFVCFLLAALCFVGIFIFSSSRNGLLLLGNLNKLSNLVSDLQKEYARPATTVPPPFIVGDKRDFMLQKQIFASQNAPRHMANGAPPSLVNFHLSIVPEISCPSMVRLGVVGDSGKWICNPWRLPENCVVYSLGVGNAVSFEKHVANLTNGRCSLHSFDPDRNYERLFVSIRNAHFYPWRMKAQTKSESNAVSLPDAMKKLGHFFVDVLKIDIEGSEYDIIPSVLGEKPLFCHLLIEIHSFTQGQRPRSTITVSAAKKWASLLKLIHEHQYWLYSKEANPDCATCAYEYSFVHESCREQYGVKLEPHHSNF